MNVERLQALTKQLIAIDSTSGNEAEIVRFMAQHLAERGMMVKQLPVDGARKNILATYDSTPPAILFNTHLDTVPEQYGPFEDGGRIYGRGACDTHGILASQLEALDALHEQGIRGLGLLLVVGEETTHDGAICAARCRDIHEPDVLIVGEPTENKFIASQQGRLKLEICAHGVAGHSGYPQQFDSAVAKLLDLLSEIRAAEWLANDSAAGTTVNIILNRSGLADNQIPDSASARLMFRCAEPCSIIKERVEEITAGVRARPQRPEADHPHFELRWDPKQSDPIASLATLPGFESGTAAFNTDIAYFGWHGCKTFLIGPGSILNAHKNLNRANWLEGEWILKDEQISAVELYKKIVRSSV